MSRTTEDEPLRSGVNAALETKGIWLAYGERQVLRGAEFRGECGEIVGLLGANGAGKTTLLKVMAGLVRPDLGSVWVGGVSPHAEPSVTRRRFAYVPNQSLLYPTLSALENLSLFATLWEVPAKLASARAETSLRALGLWEVRDQWLRAYSQGMQQKVALCAALLHEPAVILLDEALTGLDAASTSTARELLRERTSRGAFVLFSSHSRELVDALADRVVWLQDGVIEIEKPPGPDTVAGQVGYAVDGDPDAH